MIFLKILNDFYIYSNTFQIIFGHDCTKFHDKIIKKYQKFLREGIIEKNSLNIILYSQEQC